MANLDEIDRQLLQELQAEGRVTNVELARRVGLTAPPCLRRVRALEDMGVIRGYHADLEPSKLGFAIIVFAMVSLKSQAESALREFEEPLVVEAKALLEDLKDAADASSPARARALHAQITLSHPRNALPIHVGTRTTCCTITARCSSAFTRT